MVWEWYHRAGGVASTLALRLPPPWPSPVLNDGHQEPLPCGRGGYNSDDIPKVGVGGVLSQEAVMTE